MSGLHHRHPDVAMAVLCSSQVIAEFICDGHHVAPEMNAFTCELKGPQQLILVTDSMRAKCLGDGDYTLGNLAVQVRNKVARLHDGTLAGSILTMDDAVKNTIASTGCSLADTVTMTSENPAKVLRLWNRKGSLKQDKDADIVCLDSEYNVIATWVNGQQVNPPS